MSNGPCQDDAKVSAGQPPVSRYRLALGHIRNWLFLNIWCRYLYRPVMRATHKLHIHYAPPSPMPPQDGQRQLWCQWCGLRGNTSVYDPAKPLGVRVSKSSSGSTDVEFARVTLSLQEILALATFASTRGDREGYDAEELEAGYVLEFCEHGISVLDNDDGSVRKFRVVAHLEDYPEEGCMALGEPLVEPVKYVNFCCDCGGVDCHEVEAPTGIVYCVKCGSENRRLIPATGARIRS